MVTFLTVISLVSSIVNINSCTFRFSLIFWILYLAAPPLDITNGIKLGMHWSRFAMKVDSRLAVVILLYSSLICVTQNKATWYTRYQN